MCELAGCPNVRDRVDPYKGDLSYSRTTFNAAVHPLTLALLRCSVSMAAEVDACSREDTACQNNQVQRAWHSEP